MTRKHEHRCLKCRDCWACVKEGDCWMQDLSICDPCFDVIRKSDPKAREMIKPGRQSGAYGIPGIE